MNLVIVSGQSGAGKSAVLNILEDLGYYCIDNMPIEWLSDLANKLGKKYPFIAVSIDVRNIGSFTDFDHLFRQLKSTYETCEVIFLTATNEVLIKRFSETRRKHPLTDQTTNLKEALEKEKDILRILEDYIDFKIDTSRLAIHELRRRIREGVKKENNQLFLLFQSFGYKYGVPVDTDFIFDVRCLPNPNWEKELHPLTGLDAPVIKYLESFPDVESMYHMIENFIKTWLPTFESENRKYLTISIGCTGGQHRSVYFINKLYQTFKKQYQNVSVRHRDMEN